MAQAATKKRSAGRRQPPPRGRPYYDVDAGRTKILPPGGGKAVDYVGPGEKTASGRARQALRRSGVRTAQAADRAAARAPRATTRALRRADALPNLGGGPQGMGGLLIYGFAAIVGLALLENLLSGRGPAAYQTVLGAFGGGLKKLVDAGDPIFGKGTVTSNASAPTAAAGAAAPARPGSSSRVGGGSYVNPLGGLRYQLGRVDQGLDIEAGAKAVGQPIGAIGDAKVVAVSRNYGGFGQYVAYKLLNGPMAGKVIFVGHSKVANVAVGQNVRAGQPVAYVQGYNASPGHLEIGFASPTDPYSTLGRAQGTVDPVSHYSPAGAAFSSWWHSIFGGGR